MKVLSLFDGISCGYVALQRAGVPVERYYASEINADAIKISLTNAHARLQTDITTDRNQAPRNLYRLGVVVFFIQKMTTGGRFG